jgi:hypothetical protein
MSVAVPFRPSSGVVDDRYFIQPAVAAGVAKWIKKTLKSNKIIVSRVEDPCAGSGEMARHFANVTSYDLTPEPNDHGVTITARDFLTHTQDHEPGLLMVMNVPYGRNSSGAIKFINHAAKFADTVAVLVPSTWARDHNMVSRRVDKCFHLVDQALLPQNSFYAPDTGGTIHDVPSAVQVWVRKSYPRPAPTRVTSSKWFTAKQNKGVVLNTQPDLAIRRVGYVGEVITNGFDDLTEAGWWFINITRDKRRVKRAFASIDWTTYGARMGPQSINKAELITAVEHWLATN